MRRDDVTGAVARIRRAADLLETTEHDEEVAEVEAVLREVADILADR